MIGPMSITILPRMVRGTAAAGGGGGGSVEGDEPPPPCCAWSPSPSQGGFSPPSSLLLQFPAQGGVEAVGEAAEARLHAVDPVRHEVVGDDRRDGREQPERGREQHRRDTRRPDPGAGGGGPGLVVTARHAS